MFRTSKINEYTYFNNIHDALSYCKKINGNIEGCFTDKYILLWNKYIVIGLNDNQIKIFNILEEALEYKNELLKNIKNPMLWVNVGKVEKIIDWLSFNCSSYLTDILHDIDR